MAPQKGKQGTKGQQQIYDENKATLNFYRTMALGANGIYIAVTLLFFEFNFFAIAMFLLTSFVYLASLQFMAYMARATLSEKGQVVDSGVDLNMEGGVAENIKDVIILTTGSQLLSLISNYFWFLLLLAPARGLFMLWKNVLAPYFFQPAPAEQELDEKKQKKLDRKMRRQQH